MDLPWYDVGGEHYDTSQILRFWGTRVGVTVAPWPEALAWGSTGLKLSSGSEELWPPPWDAAEDTLYMGMAIITDNMNMDHSGFVFLKGSVIHAQLTLVLNDNGSVSVHVGSATSPLATYTSDGGLFTANVRFYLEFGFTINSVTGSFEVRINGTNVLSRTGINTSGDASSGTDLVRLRGSLSAIYMRDIYFRTGGFLGEQKMVVDYPIADGTLAQWAPITGTSHFAMVDDPGAQDDDATYNETLGAGKIDTFQFPALSVSFASISAVKVSAVHRKTDAGAHVMNSLLRKAGANYVGPNRTQSSSYADGPGTWETDPATAVAFTQAGAEAFEAGYKLVS